MQRNLDRIGHFSKGAILAAATLPMMFATLPAQAADYIAPASVSASANEGLCSQQSVLRRVVSGFSYQTRHVPDLPRVSISAMSDVRLNRFEPKNNLGQIERTYCQATAVLSDGQQRPIWYFVEQGQGYAGIGSNVEFCADGFDSWYVYNSRCRTAR